MNSTILVFPQGSIPPPPPPAPCLKVPTTFEQREKGGDLFTAVQ